MWVACVLHTVAIPQTIKSTRKSHWSHKNNIHLFICIIFWWVFFLHVVRVNIFLFLRLLTALIASIVKLVGFKSKLNWHRATLFCQPKNEIAIQCDGMSEIFFGFLFLFPFFILRIIDFHYFANGKLYSINIILFLSRSIWICFIILFYRCSLVGDRNHMFVSNCRSSHYFLKHQQQHHTTQKRCDLFLWLYHSQNRFIFR